MTAPAPSFPFSAVVGQDDAKLALVLNAVDPGIGGVVLRGHKGSAKTTLVRALARLLDRPFVELPLGATEDRLIGSIDVGAALTGGGVRFQPGLLAAAHAGVLYVDEVNLLPDHLVDSLLDVAASGVNRVERDGVAHEHPSRFVLIGSMNPEEGDLRPQLLDRFGLAAEARSLTEPHDRALAVERRLAFDGDGAEFVAAWQAEEDELRARLRRSRPAAVGNDLRLAIASLCAAVGAEGLRADLTLTRAAAALAGWEGRRDATEDDVRRVAPMVLAHRARRSPLDDAGGAPDQLEAALGDAFSGSEDGGAPPPTTTVAGVADDVALVPLPGRPKRPAARGRLVAERVAADGVTSLAVAATARAAAVRRDADPDGPPVVAADLRNAVREQRVSALVVLTVDASASMHAARRIEAAKGAVVRLLLDAYQRRDRVAVVAFRGDDADVVLRPTGSVEVARARVAELESGGATPLAAGIDAARAVAEAATDHDPVIVLVSDGRATSAPPGADPVAEAMAAARRVRGAGIASVVVDAEQGSARLGLAREVADAMGASLVQLDELSADALAGAVRAAVHAR